MVIHIKTVVQIRVKKRSNDSIHLVYTTKSEVKKNLLKLTLITHKLLSVCSLTMSNRLTFMFLVKRPHINLLILSSICLKLFHDSHPCTNTERTMVSNSFSFVCKDTPLLFQTHMFLKAAPDLPIVIPTSFRCFHLFVFCILCTQNCPHIGWFDSQSRYG